MVANKLYQKQNIQLNYYQIKNNLQPLILIHAQGVDAVSFENVLEQLSKSYHIYSIDCYGHGESFPLRTFIWRIDCSLYCFQYGILQLSDFGRPTVFSSQSREQVKPKMIGMATKYRKKHPDRNLKVMFWPKAAFSGFRGMNNYDPLFGENFYNGSSHCGILHEEILRNIKCKTIFMKTQTNISENSILMAALSGDDLKKVSELISDCNIIRFGCGHGIHIEKPKEFIECLSKL